MSPRLHHLDLSLLLGRLATGEGGENRTELATSQQLRRYTELGVAGLGHVIKANVRLDADPDAELIEANGLVLRLMNGDSPEAKQGRLSHSGEAAKLEEERNG